MTIPKTLKIGPIHKIEEDKTVLEAAQQMAKYDVGALIVVKGELSTGIITERDLLKKIAAKSLDPRVELVKSIMTKEVINVTEDDTIAEAIKLMLEYHIRHLPLLSKKDELLGILSFRDLYRCRLEELENENNTLEALLCIDCIGG